MFWSMLNENHHWMLKLDRILNRRYYVKNFKNLKVFIRLRFTLRGIMKTVYESQTELWNCSFLARCFTFPYQASSYHLWKDDAFASSQIPSVILIGWASHPVCVCWECGCGEGGGSMFIYPHVVLGICTLLLTTLY